MWRDICGEALAAMLARPQRTALTALGTLVGIAALVATVGLSATAGAQIVSRFDELAATTVTVTPVPADAGQGPRNVIPWDAPDRLSRLNGVVAAGTLSPLDVGNAEVRATRVVDPLHRDAVKVPVVAASASLCQAVRCTLAAGRWFDRGHDARGDRVVVLGGNVARQLSLADLSQQPAVFVGDEPFTVIGVLTGVERNESLLNSVIMPEGAARSAYGLDAPMSVVIETRVGAADLITRQAPVALAPQDPRALVAQRPPEPTITRAKVSGDVQVLFLVLGGLSLLIGGVGIANTTLVSVLERTGEIGLRRSIGGTRRSIAGLFVVESTLTGLIGGVLGASLGILTVVGFSYLSRWRPVLDGWLPPTAAAIGAVIGLLAGVYPAWRASRVEPVAALRAGQR